MKTQRFPLGLFLILMALLFVFQGCNLKNRSVTGLKKGVWYVSHQQSLALNFAEDGTLVRGSYLLTGRAVSEVHGFEARPTRKGLIFKFNGNPEMELKGSLIASGDGYTLVTPRGRNIRFDPVVENRLPGLPGRYAVPRFDRVIRTERVYGYAPGYYASKPLTDLSPAAYPGIVLDVLNDVTFNMFTDSIRLDLDLYTPVDDSLDQRPLVVYIHGGAFVVGDKRDELARRLATYYAQCGYVVASINYRLGYPFIPGIYSQLERCIYRGIQDVRAALRYLSYHHKSLGIDPNQVFLAGNSAGGFYSLFTAFKEDGDQWGSARRSLFGLRKELGCLDCSGNQLKGKYRIAGVINLWGGITDLNLIGRHEKVPVYMVHGTADRIVPYDFDYPFKNIDKRLSSFFSKKVYGSKPIYDHMKLLGYDVTLITIPNGRHEPQDDDDNTYTMIRSGITAFMHRVIGGQPLRITGPMRLDTGMGTARYVALNERDEKVQWRVEQGIITRQGRNWVEVVWFSNSPHRKITAVTLAPNGHLRSAEAIPEG